VWSSSERFPVRDAVLIQHADDIATSATSTFIVVARRPQSRFGRHDAMRKNVNGIT